MYSSLCLFDFMFSASGVKFAEVDHTTYKVGNDCNRLCTVSYLFLLYVLYEAMSEYNIIMILLY